MCDGNHAIRNHGIVPNAARKIRQLAQSNIAQKQQKSSWTKRVSIPTDKVQIAAKYTRVLRFWKGCIVYQLLKDVFIASELIFLMH